VKKFDPAGMVIDDIGSVMLADKYWIVGYSPLKKNRLRGVCLLPKRKRGGGAIVVSTHVGRRMKAVTAIHESLHAVFPRASEKQIERGANFIAKVLEKYGVQLVEIDEVPR
jgi:hypothetical protein